MEHLVYNREAQTQQPFFCILATIIHAKHVKIHETQINPPCSSGTVGQTLHPSEPDVSSARIFPSGVNRRTSGNLVAFGYVVAKAAPAFLAQAPYPAVLTNAAAPEFLALAPLPVVLTNLAESHDRHTNFAAHTCAAMPALLCVRAASSTNRTLLPPLPPSRSRPSVTLERIRHVDQHASILLPSRRLESPTSAGWSGGGGEGKQNIA